MNFGGRSYETCSGTAQVPNYPVGNSTNTNGPMNMYRAAQRSVNTYFLQLELAVGLCPVVKMAEKLGVHSSTPDAPISSYDQTPSFTLGTPEVDPLSMAEAYATFASGGIHCSPIIVDTITNPTGDQLEAPSGNCTRVLSADVANAMNALLASVMTQGTGQIVRTADGRDQAGKTGTIDSNKAVWFVGYTPSVAGAAMISIDNQAKPFVKGNAGSRAGLKGYQVPSTGQSLSGSGSGDAGQEIWKPVMEKYLADQPKTKFESAPAELLQGRTTNTSGRNGLRSGRGDQNGSFPIGPRTTQPGDPGRR
jgi:membrane peptidoglycan carboxypeptidase